MHCGDITFDWGTMSTLSQCLWSRCPVEQSVYFSAVFGLETFISFHENRDDPQNTLDELLVAYPPNFESSEPRDKVYALLGLPYLLLNSSNVSS